MSIAMKLYRSKSSCLLDAVAAEKAEQLYSDALQGICRRVALCSVEYRSTYVLTVYVWVFDLGLDGNLGCHERVFVSEDDGEMKGCFANWR